MTFIVLQNLWQSATLVIAKRQSVRKLQVLFNGRAFSVNKKTKLLQLWKIRYKMILSDRDRLMELTNILRKIELFNGLSKDELRRLASKCIERRLERGEVITTQGVRGDELFIVTEGLVEVLITEGKKDSHKIIVNLGEGQLVGEMSLVDKGPRSATVRAITDSTVVQVIHRDQFEALCEENTHIGFVVMRNIATDLSFKIRHRNLSEGSW